MKHYFIYILNHCKWFFLVGINIEYIISFCELFTVLPFLKILMPPSIVNYTVDSSILFHCFINEILY
jgi:hypothetical protein